MNKGEVISEIQKFLEGNPDGIKYIVNVETSKANNIATCIINEPGKPAETQEVKYKPFIYIMDLKNNGINLYNGDKDRIKHMMGVCGITIKKVDTNKQPRLENGYCYLVQSKNSFNDILKFFKEGGCDPYEKERDEYGEIVKSPEGRPYYKYSKFFYMPRGEEQFFISTGNRLYMGMDEYKDIHKLYFDIETTGLRYKIHRIFAIGLRDNRGYQKLLTVSKDNDDDAERELIKQFFLEIRKVMPAVIAGYNSENFDFEFIVKRATTVLKMDLKKDIPTTLNENYNIWRGRGTVKIGNGSEDYTRTNAWGYSIIDINHATKKAQAIDTEMKNTKLKYVCQYSKINKDDRMYIKGDEIGKFWGNNNIFIINPENSNYLEIPEEFQEQGEILYNAQEKKINEEISEDDYKFAKSFVLKNNPELVKWFKAEGKKYGQFKFITGKEILKQYLLDDVWETEQIDELYNQSAFMLAKIVPTTFERVNTMGTASIWNLLLTAWSFHNNLAIPHSDDKKTFTGGLSRCFRVGYYKNVTKIDFASLYPMLQLEYDIFPIFDTTGVIKKMLMYMTTTRNIYKKLANGDKLQDEELELLRSTGHDDTYQKILSGEEFSSSEKAAFKIKQLPIKILNNSLFGALGSGYSFNWSDNICAERITCFGRLHLRKAITWFSRFGLVPLLAVTDGINFGIPERTNIRITDTGVKRMKEDAPIDEMWEYKGLTGVSAVIELYNASLKSPYMGVDNDGNFISCYNLARINYSLLVEKKNKKTGELERVVKNTGNTIKSKGMPEYIEDFIDNGMKLILEGDGAGFYEYYKSYVEDIFYRQIPLKKIATKKKMKTTIDGYLRRGVDKNGKVKSRQAHMELIIKDREKKVHELFEKMADELIPDREKELSEYTLEEKRKIVTDYMPPEPELDSMIYYVNTGTRKSHGDVKTLTNKETGEEEILIKADLISERSMKENPDLKGEYNVDKYFDAFNKRVVTLLKGFDEEVRKRFLAVIEEKKIMGPDKKKLVERKLKFNEFTNKELELSSYEHDSIDETMHLIKSEVDFWNLSGYDPYKVWDGFKVYDDLPIDTDDYDTALVKFSEILKKNVGKEIKSVNDQLLQGDFVLYKHGETYDLGFNNGEYIEIINQNIHYDVS